MELSCTIFHHCYLPVVINFLFEGDDVSLLEAELPGILRLKVVQRLTAWLRQLGGRGAGRVAGGRRHTGVKARAEGGGHAPVSGRVSWRGSGAGGDQGPAGDVAENMQHE